MLSRSAGDEPCALHAQEFADVGDEGAEAVFCYITRHGETPFGCFDTAYYSGIGKSPRLFRRPENLFSPDFIGPDGYQGEFIPDFLG